LNGTSSQIILTGAELKDTLTYSLIPQVSWVASPTVPTSAECPILAFSTTLTNVIAAIELKVTNEQIRLCSGLDIQGAAKVAGYLALSSFSDLVKVFGPFLSNSVGNLFTDDKLADFASIIK
jgi:hypothetical protein